MSSSSDFEMRDFLPYLLAQAAEETSRHFARHYKARYGMLRTEWRVLFHLGRYGAMTARDICDRAMIHKTKISRAVAKLEEKRFLLREEVESDRRRELLHLTEAGRRVFADLTAFAETYDRDLIARLGAKDGAVLKRCLRDLGEARGFGRRDKD